MNNNESQFVFVGATCYHDSTENTVWPRPFLSDERNLVSDSPHNLRINLFLYDGGIWRERFKKDPNYQIVPSLSDLEEADRARNAKRQVHGIEMHKQ